MLKLLQDKNSTINQLVCDKKHLNSKIEKLEKEINNTNTKSCQQKSKLEELTNILSNSNHSQILKKKFLHNPFLKKEFKSFSKGEKKVLMMIQEECEKIPTKKNEENAFLQMGKNFSGNEDDSTELEKWCKENKEIENFSKNLKVPCNSLILEENHIQELINNPNIQINSKKRYEFLENDDDEKILAKNSEKINEIYEENIVNKEINESNEQDDDILENLNVLKYKFKAILDKKKHQYTHSLTLNNILSKKNSNSHI